MEQILESSETVPPRFRVNRIFARRVLNSQSGWINEFIVELLGGIQGIGSSPQGETLSTYEQGSESDESGETVVQTICEGDFTSGDIDQIQYDMWLDVHRPIIGQNNAFALSLAFLNAGCNSLNLDPHDMLTRIYGVTNPKVGHIPRLLLNVLNGGQHAYTNPIQSDFSEYLLVPRSDGLQAQVDEFHAINQIVSDKLGRLPMVRVGSNWVHRQTSADNRKWIDFLLDILRIEGLDYNFDVMVDASAGDLFENGKYQFRVTDGRVFTPDDFVEYWSSLLKDYPISILEDPFAEEDARSWRALTKRFSDLLITGDNLCATDARRISNAAEGGLVSAVLIKPNQAGTVTATVRALQAAKEFGIPPIPSHRSIETENSFLSDLCYAYGVRYAKLGLLSDFETIIKLNKLIRYSEHAGDHNRKARRHRIQRATHNSRSVGHSDFQGGD
jgi:enolase